MPEAARESPFTGPENTGASGTDIHSAPDSEANARQTIATAAEKMRRLFIRRELYHTQPPIHAFYAQRMTIDIVAFDYPYLATDLLHR